MRFYTKHHQFYCGIDLHARTMYVCIIDHEGTVLTHRNMPATAETLADVLQPYREDLVLAVECIFNWYWVADLCARIGVEFVLDHALYMKAIHGGKGKNDKIGNVHLKWAFSEAACLFLRRNVHTKYYHKRLISKYGNAKALSIIAQKLGRTVYSMLKRRTPFDSKQFFETVG